jgi:ParB family chromosome partitioning protein
MEIKMIPIDKIRPAPFQPRETFDKEKIKELADSIKEADLIEPILVRENGDSYQIIAGERRWRAWHEVGQKEIPAIVRNVDDIMARELSLIENWQREDLSSTEREKMVYALWKSGRYKSRAELAKKLGVDPRTITDIIMAKQLRDAERIPTTISTKTIKATRGLDTKERKQIIKKVLQEEIRASEIEEYVATIKESSEPVREALLRPKSKIDMETAKTITRKFPSKEQQRAIIKEIEKSEEIREEGIRAYVEDRAAIVSGERAPDITIRDPHKRLVDLYSRIYSDVITISAEHVMDLPKSYREEAINYMKRAHAHLERELSRVGELKFVGR